MVVQCLAQSELGVGIRVAPFSGQPRGLLPVSQLLLHFSRKHDLKLD